MMLKEVKNEAEMRSFGMAIGTLLLGGEFIELSGDVGSGKTTLAKGIAIGLGVQETVQSPSFTIKRVYDARDNLILTHYDFYRLIESGIMSDELQESISDPSVITIVEWGGVVDGVLPQDRLTIRITSPTENYRELVLSASGGKSKVLLGKLSS